MCSSFSSKVIPLGKTRKVRKSPFFAPKIKVFLVVVVTASTVDTTLVTCRRKQVVLNSIMTVKIS